MKMTKRFWVLLVVLALMVSMVPSAAAANNGNKTVHAGKSTTVTFTYKDVKGVQGSIKFSNPELFTSLEVTVTGGSGAHNISLDPASNGKFFFSNATTTDIVIKLVLTTAKGATAGDSCKITSTYEVTVDGEVLEAKAEESVTVKIIDRDPTNPPMGEEETTTAPIDYSELERQIAIAEGLIETDYTAESWANMLAALKDARAALSSDSQTVVDAAAQALADAIAALVRMDFSKLIAAMEKVRGLGDTEELANLWLQMYDLFDEAKLAMVSGDQAWVDELTQKILDLLAKIIEEIAAMKNPEQVTIEVPVEVEPTEPYCNIPMHKVWPILFFVSLGLNVIFLVLFVTMSSKKKKKTADKTPMVDYDIGDDA